MAPGKKAIEETTKMLREVKRQLEELQEGIDEWERVMQNANDDRDQWLKPPQTKGCRSMNKKLDKMVEKRTHDISLQQGTKRVGEKIHDTMGKLARRRDTLKELTRSLPPDAVCDDKKRPLADVVQEALQEIYAAQDKVKELSITTSGVRAHEAVQREEDPEVQEALDRITEALGILGRERGEMDEQLAGMEWDQEDIETVRAKIERHEWHILRLEALRRHLDRHDFRPGEDVRRAIDAAEQYAAGARAASTVAFFRDFDDQEGYSGIPLCLPTSGGAASSAGPADDNNPDTLCGGDRPEEARTSSTSSTRSSRREPVAADAGSWAAAASLGAQRPTGRPRSRPPAAVAAALARQAPTISAASAAAPGPKQPPSPPAAGGHRYKTELCTFYPKGMCVKGSTCGYAHSKSELRPLAGAGTQKAAAPTVARASAAPPARAGSLPSSSARPMPPPPPPAPAASRGLAEGSAWANLAQQRADAAPAPPAPRGPAAPAEVLNSERYPRRPGEAACESYLKHGVCEPRDICPYDHPELVRYEGKISSYSDPAGYLVSPQNFDGELYFHKSVCSASLRFPQVGMPVSFSMVEDLETGRQIARNVGPLPPRPPMPAPPAAAAEEEEEEDYGPFGRKVPRAAVAPAGAPTGRSPPPPYCPRPAPDAGASAAPPSGAIMKAPPTGPSAAPSGPIMKAPPPTGQSAWVPMPADISAVPCKAATGARTSTAAPPVKAAPGQPMMPTNIDTIPVKAAPGAPARPPPEVPVKAAPGLPMPAAASVPPGQAVIVKPPPPTMPARLAEEVRPKAPPAAAWEPPAAAANVESTSAAAAAAPPPPPAAAPPHLSAAPPPSPPPPAAADVAQEQPAPAQPSAGGSLKLGLIREVIGWHSRRILTDEQFSRAKKQILSAGEGVPQMVQDIRDAISMRQDGALDEDEFAEVLVLALGGQ